MSVFAVAGYTRLRSCGQEVINSVVSGFQCSTNDCMCRSDIMTSAIAAINVGALDSCSDNAIDATSAMGVYINYCESNNYTPPSFATTIFVPKPVGECNSSFHHFLNFFADKFQGNTSPVLHMQSVRGYQYLHLCAQRGLRAGIKPFFCSTNDCLCRQDIKDLAVSSISATVSSYCEESSRSSAHIDVSSATSAFLGYCSSNGYHLPTTTTITPGTSIFHIGRYISQDDDEILRVYFYHADRYEHASCYEHVTSILCVYLLPPSFSEVINNVHR